MHVCLLFHAVVLAFALLVSVLHLSHPVGYHSCSLQQVANLQAVWSVKGALSQLGRGGLCGCVCVWSSGSIELGICQP